MRRLLGVLIVALLVLTACGDDDTPSVKSSSDQSGDHGGHGGNKDKCGEAGTSLSLSASSSIAFEKDCLSAPANRPLTITFENKEAGVPHNVAVAKEHSSPILFKGEVKPGPSTDMFNVGPLEAGTYHFHCEVHPATMQGTIKVV